MITNHEPAEAMHEKVVSGLRMTRERLAGLDVEEFIIPELYKPSRYILGAEGKMLRPALVFMGSIYAGNDSIDEVVDIATAVELLHTSSLIHDDIIDQDNKRRGVASTHVKYGTNLAILAGDALISSAIQRISGYGQDMINAMARTAMEMAAGEALDAKFQRSGTVPTIEQYKKIARLKSASLISTSSCIAAMYKGREHVRPLAEFGMHFGIAFQIRDDIDDFIENEEDALLHPNAVRSIMKSGTGEKKALAMAAKMNIEYIKRGLAALDPKRRGIFEQYVAQMLMDQHDLEH
ncbi:MAG: polyprenyl synthetase family protein [Candidatus Marsarchaeota archaeon]|jgi:geranylgeranyl pyrophosphate synthase|nr:polyprenyl synthetase family protein [Candidatus Marsarchaeota archaeon]